MPSQHPEAKKLISQGIFDSIKSFREFEGRVSKLFEINTKILGDAFEIFVEAYLATQPIMQCAETYLVSQLPLDVRNELNLPNNSSGVDGVYKSNSGVLVPYQVKFRSNRPPLSLTEVATFLGLTERAKDRVLITNCDEIARDVKNRDYLRSIRGQDFDLLEETDFKLIEAWLKEKPVKRELPKPRPYQEVALKDIKNTLTTHDRATTVMACGTGKTLVALWAVEQAQVNTVLVLLPSLTLMQQTLLEWSKNNSWGSRFSFICVCSDPTVKANDEIEIDPTDIDFKVDTDPKLVKEFLNQKNEKVKVVFSTYQSSKIVGEAIKGLSPFDFAIFDEAHKTTGPKGGVFAFALDDQNISIKKRLFLTATPRHFDIRHRDKEGEFKVISMDDESIYGPKAHSLTFGSAANQGIICNYKVIISLIDKNQVDDFALKNGITLVENDKIGTRWVASQIALQQAIEKVNASKIITFHSRVKLAQEFSSETSHGIKRYLKDFKVMHVNGEQRSNERTDLIRQFKDSPKSLITNARCLTEGVDVPAVDMVAFIDARHSKVDIAQAIGRAMRIPRGSKKKFGYIVVPLFADTSDLNNLEETIKKEGFDDVAEILNALQEQDEELVDIIKELQEAKGRGEIFNPKRLSGKVETIGPYLNLQEISANVYTEIVNQLGISWDFWFGLLQKYSDVNHTSRIHADLKYEGLAIGRWVSSQRQNYKKNILTQVKIARLESLPEWLWDKYDESWEVGYSKLLSYAKQYNKSNVPQSFIYEGFELGKWCAFRRRLFRKLDRLSQERVKKLEALPGWSWDYSEKDEAWYLAYEILKKYFEEFGSTIFPAKLKYKNFNLGQWAYLQRFNHRSKKLTEPRVKHLEKFDDWIWDIKELGWINAYKLLKKYQKKYGNCKPPRKYIDDGISLGAWVSVQVSLYNKKQMAPERIKLLEDIPEWSWSPLDDLWDSRFELLKEYLSSNSFSSLSLKTSYRNIKIGLWVTVQKRKYRENVISPSRIEKLEALPGWIWSVK
jgi:superfamily II DNA or RNA helicase